MEKGCTEEYIDQLTEKLKSDAMSGDVNARRLLLERLAAPPANMDLVEEIREIKAELARRKAIDGERYRTDERTPRIDG